MALAPTWFVADAKKEWISKAVNIALAILFFPLFLPKVKGKVLKKLIIIIAVWQKAKKPKKGISYQHTK